MIREAVDRSRARALERAVDELVGGLDGLTEAQIARILEALADVRRTVIAELHDSAQTGFRAEMLGRLRLEIDQAAEVLRRRLAPLVADGIARAWGAGAAFPRAVPASLGVQVAPALTLGPTIGLDHLRVLTTIGFDLVTSVSADFRERARAVLARGVLGAVPPQTLIGQVADLLRTEPGRRPYDPRYGPIASQAELLVRTELVGAFNTASQLGQARLAHDLPGIQKTWRSARDGRVRDAHRLADERYSAGGEVGPIPFEQDFEVGSEACAFPHDPRLTARSRVNCRCIAMPWHPDWVAR